MNRIFLLALIFCTGSLTAQELSYGFEVGLNFSSIIGPSEADAAGNDLESFRSATGFHVGGNIRLKFVDRFGMKAEILFSQKGGRHVFDGEAFQVFTTETEERVLTQGQRRSVVTVTNSYIDIPITGYWRPTSRIELFAGANVAFLVSSTGIGELIYDGQASIGGDPIEFIAAQDHNYYNDEGRLQTSLNEFEEPISFLVNGERVEVPDPLGAYYLDFDEKDGSFYNFFDVGLVAGVHLYFNGSLYFGFRANYGLLDATNNTYDISRTEVEDLAPLPREDRDVNLSLQGSIGFSF
ncbi:MAG: outer membrane beta-barrel protein [Bacteroidota bacterium]